MPLKLIASLAIFTLAAAAQNYEIGAAIGNGAYRNATVTAPSSQAKAGMGDSIAPSVVVCDNMYNHVSGEFRYLY